MRAMGRYWSSSVWAMKRLKPDLYILKGPGKFRDGFGLQPTPLPASAGLAQEHLAYHSTLPLLSYPSFFSDPWNRRNSNLQTETLASGDAWGLLHAKWFSLQ